MVSDQGMHYDENGRAWVLDDFDALRHWTILLAEKWKAGVVRLHLRAGLQFRLVYANGYLCPTCGQYTPNPLKTDK